MVLKRLINLGANKGWFWCLENAWGLGDNETDTLHLTNVVKSNNTDEGVGVLLLAFFNLLHDLS